MNALTNSSVGNGFDTVFSEIDSTKKLNLKNNNCLRLFYLDISNNEFTYNGLHRLLQRNVGRYVFSRACTNTKFTRRIDEENTKDTRNFAYFSSKQRTESSGENSPLIYEKSVG